MLFYLDEDNLYFPSHDNTNEEGILAIGGALTSEWLLLAYEHGIFPWFNPEDPIIWWSPDPRFVLNPKDLKVSKSMCKLLKKNYFKITYNEDFEQVISNCKTINRPDQEGDSWITDEMRAAYIKLHEQGFAKSVEVWLEGELVGGLYGIEIGNVFCGESMFAKVSNASKAGFISFVKDHEHLYDIIDCQYHTKHLESLGAGHISRDEFLSYLPLYKDDFQEP